MLTEAFTQPFPLPIGKKIMEVLDVDGDGYLCLLDLFSLFYLTEIYMQALGGTFTFFSFCKFYCKCATVRILFKI